MPKASKLKKVDRAKGSKASRKARQSTGFKGFVNLDEDEASRRTTKKARPELTDIYLDRLVLSEMQRNSINALYTQSRTYSRRFDPSKEEQIEAAALLAAHALDDNARECMMNKWHIRWSEMFGHGKEKTRHILYQWCVTYNLEYTSFLSIFVQRMQL